MRLVLIGIALASVSCGDVLLHRFSNGGLGPEDDCASPCVEWGSWRSIPQGATYVYWRGGGELHGPIASNRATIEVWGPRAGGSRSSSPRSTLSGPRSAGAGDGLALTAVRPRLEQGSRAQGLESHTRAVERRDPRRGRLGSSDTTVGAQPATVSLPHLDLEKRVARRAHPQDRIRFMLQIHNHLDRFVEELIVVDHVPAKLAVLSAGGAEIQPVDDGGTLVIWRDRRLDAGQTRNYSIEVRIPSTSALTSGGPR